MKPYIVYNMLWENQLFLYIPIEKSSDPFEIADLMKSDSSIRCVYQVEVFKYKEHGTNDVKRLAIYRVECKDIKNDLQKIEDMINNIEEQYRKKQ